MFKSLIFKSVLETWNNKIIIKRSYNEWIRRNILNNNEFNDVFFVMQKQSGGTTPGLNKIHQL